MIKRLHNKLKNKDKRGMAILKVCLINDYHEQLSNGKWKEEEKRDHRIHV